MTALMWVFFLSVNLILNEWCSVAFRAFENVLLRFICLKYVWCRLFYNVKKTKYFWSCHSSTKSADKRDVLLVKVYDLVLVESCFGLHGFSISKRALVHVNTGKKSDSALKSHTWSHYMTGQYLVCWLINHWFTFTDELKRNFVLGKWRQDNDVVWKFLTAELCASLFGQWRFKAS